MNPSGRFFSPLEVRIRLESWCAYQDRCEFEVCSKLNEFDIDQKDKDLILSGLQSQGFCDNERFTESFVSGKFRIKRWGRIKIRQALYAKKIAVNLIQKYTEQIDDVVYLQTIDALLIKKNNLLANEKDLWKKQMKISQYVASRGFETDLIQDRIQILKKTNEIL